MTTHPILRHTYRVRGVPPVPDVEHALDVRQDVVAVRPDQHTPWRLEPAATHAADPHAARIATRGDADVLVIRGGVVRFALVGSPTLPELAAQLDAAGCVLGMRFAFAAGLYSWQARPGETADGLALADRLRALPGVIWAEPDVVEQIGPRAPGDPVSAPRGTPWTSGRAPGGPCWTRLLPDGRAVEVALGERAPDAAPGGQQTNGVQVWVRADGGPWRLATCRGARAAQTMFDAGEDPAAPR